jgi:hypothetical protein
MMVTIFSTTGKQGVKHEQEGIQLYYGVKYMMASL